MWGFVIGSFLVGYKAGVRLAFEMPPGRSAGATRERMKGYQGGVIPGISGNVLGCRLPLLVANRRRSLPRSFLRSQSLSQSGRSALEPEVKMPRMHPGPKWASV